MDKFSLLSGYHEPVLADTGAATAPARAAAEMAGEMGAGTRLLAREDEERARLQEKADRMADAGSFEDVKRLMEEERGYGIMPSWRRGISRGGRPAGMRW